MGGLFFPLYIKIYERLKPHNAIINCAPIPKYISIYSKRTSPGIMRRLWLHFPRGREPNGQNINESTQDFSLHQRPQENP